MSTESMTPQATPDAPGAASLRECPFCGADNTSSEQSDNLGQARCCSCGAEIVCNTEAEAIAAWNRRASPDLRAKVADLEKQVTHEHGLFIQTSGELDAATDRVEELEEAYDILIAWAKKPGNFRNAAWWEEWSRRLETYLARQKALAAQMETPKGET